RPRPGARSATAPPGSPCRHDPGRTDRMRPGTDCTPRWRPWAAPGGRSPPRPAAGRSTVPREPRTPRRRSAARSRPGGNGTGRGPRCAGPGAPPPRATAARGAVRGPAAGRSPTPTPVPLTQVVTQQIQVAVRVALRGMQERGGPVPARAQRVIHHRGHVLLAGGARRVDRRPALLAGIDQALALQVAQDRGDGRVREISGQPLDDPPDRRGALVPE